MKWQDLKVISKVYETDDAVSISFEVPPDKALDYTFVSGQYLSLEAEIEGITARRSYSICAHPRDGLRVLVKRVPGGLFSNWVLDTLQVGQLLRVSTPEGLFTHLPNKEESGVYVAFAAGSGITPILSILKTVLHDEVKTRFILFYGNRTTNDIIFKEELESLKNQYMTRLQVHYLLSRESTESSLFDGRISALNCSQYFKYLIDAQEVNKVFLCGPYDMIMEMKAVLPGFGVDPHKIKFELFFNPEVEAKKQSKSAVQSDIHQRLLKVTLDGLTTELHISGQDYILDLAHAAGLDLPYSCKGGVCATCRAHVKEGVVEMDTNYALDEDEVSDGYVLTCQSRMISDEVHVDFDG